MTRAEENVTISCQYGQGSLKTVAVRECDERGEWIESNIEQCASFSDFILRSISMVCTYIHTYVRTYIHTYIRTYVCVYYYNYSP